MGVASGCGCKEVYRFPHTTYPYSSTPLVSVLFCSSILLLVHFENVFVLIPVLFCKKKLCIKKFLAQYKHKYGRPTTAI